MCDTAGTLPRQQSPTQKVFRFPTGEQALVVNVDYSVCHRTPTSWVPAIQTDKRKKSVAAQSVRALRLLRAMRL